ncbi:MAG: DNA polymerase III subunit gamma/tau [Ruminococcus sp.]|uniref:DNA polymerase III subunit gamma/tau n=1 Tax=Ruminococcus sp. TaxID=41978 RepID=UPI0025D29BEC|nr:DNA polymerase III subunit gamma/tau [Ruminococcus sp.]MCR5599818.1 DNA polymerase III subunit gamma/tau [Ruminococcus sp.]
MYKALYRKWRPMTFDDVISQQYTTEALKNQIISGKTAHAYLFTGSRGTGKTTCARILAKAVNCRNMKDGNPCLECDICRDADSGALTDIVEIDAASNNGVDNIRDLRDAAVYTPERGAYKIYIIDEVHMLSAGAFNALLKIMEEPPPYVKFILATTEIHKVPATIVSRCQRYDFRRIKAEDIAKRISYIAQQEELNLTDDGAAMIAKLADGGMRDAVSLLDQCSVCADIINAETVSNAAGIAGRDYLYDMLDAVSDSDTPKALAITANLYDMSKDLSRLCEELITQLRNIMLIKASPDTAESLIVCMPDELERLKAIAEKSDLSTVMDRLSALQECRERMQKAMNKRVEFEMSLIKLCGNIRNTTESIDNSEIYDKIKQLENKINSVPRAAAAASQAPEEPEVMEASAAPADEKIVPSIDIKKLKPEDIVPCDRWEDVLEEFRKINPAVAGSLDGSFAGTAGNYIFITAQNRFFMELFKVKENANSLGMAIANVLGQRFIIKARCSTTVTEQKNLAENLIKKAMESQIETAVDKQ